MYCKRFSGDIFFSAEYIPPCTFCETFMGSSHYAIYTNNHMGHLPQVHESLLYSVASQANTVEIHKNTTLM